MRVNYIGIVKKIIAVLVFWTFLIGVIVQLTYMYRGGLAHTRGNVSGFYDEKDDSLDVIVIGTSATFSAFVPMEAWNRWGIVSYNLCTNGMYTNSIKYYVREALKTQDPCLVVIDIAPFLFGHHAPTVMNEWNEPQARYNTDGLMLSRNRNALIREVIPKEYGRWDFYFDLFYYHRDGVPDLIYLDNKHHSISKGYSNLPIRRIYGSDEIIEGDHAEKRLDEENDKVLHELLEELREYDFPILFFAPPYLDIEGEENLSGLSAYIGSVIRQCGFDFLNMADCWEEIGIDHPFDYSLDSLHYNISSAEKITAYLSDYMVHHYDIPDRRGEEGYLLWEEDYVLWQEMLNEYRDETAGQRIQVLGETDQLEQYLDRLKSEYFSCCIWISSPESLCQDAELYNRMSELGVEIPKGKDVKDCLIIVDHSADDAILYDGDSEFIFGSTFGEIRYIGGDFPQLYINHSENSYLSGKDTTMEIFVADRATGCLVDFVVYEFNNKGNKVIRHITDNPYINK